MNNVSSNEEKTDIYSKEVLIPREEIKCRVEQLGREISKDYQGRELHLVGVLNGAFMFLADLVRNLSIPCQICLCRLPATKTSR